jgi:ribosomal protein S18 acetylase RimI-like enzyme
VVRRSWYSAYTSIYSRAEMDAVFAGRIDQHVPWGVRRRRSLGTLVAEVDGVVVGIAARALLDDGDGEIVALYVLPELQGRGVGRALWEAAVDGFRDLGCARMWVWVLERHAPAVEWYARRGCTVRERSEYSIGAHAEPSLGVTLDIDSAE